MGRGLGKTQRAILEWVYSEGKSMEFLAARRDGEIAVDQAVIDSGGEVYPFFSDFNYWQDYLDKKRAGVSGEKWKDGTPFQEDFYDGVWSLRRDSFERFWKYESREGGYVAVTTQRPSFGYEPNKVRRNSRGFAVETRSGSEVAAVSRASRTLKRRGLIVVYPSGSISLTAEGLELAKSYQGAPAQQC